MAIESSLLSLVDTVTPTSHDELADVLRAAHDARQAIYPIGGGTCLDFGLAPRREGRGLATANINQIVDYTPRDMTVVVDAGATVAALAAALAAENQHLPIDTARTEQATIGGLVATDWSGPRRYGYGTLRDYIIGIKAVDGRGVPFKGGGRVVKNVAGYDFCKLLTGSLGTLGVIGQVNFKVVPKPEMATTVVAEFADVHSADEALEKLIQLPAPATSIDLLLGTAWQDLDGLPDLVSGETVSLVVRFEGSEEDTAWIRAELERLLSSAGGKNVRSLAPADAERLLAVQTSFADSGTSLGGDQSPLVIKIAALPSGVHRLVALLREVDASCAILAHAASGIIIARFAEFDPADLTSILVGRLRPAAIREYGSLSVLSSSFEGLTAQIVWGGRVEASPLMERVKRQLDPHGILNPGRFVF